MTILKEDIKRVSIIILNYNTPEMTAKAVEKVEKSLTVLDYLIVVVDNGSKRTSFEHLCKLIKNNIIINNYTNDKILKDTINIKTRRVIIRSMENLGFSRGNNLGIKFAMNNFSPEYVLLMNSDVFVEQKGIVEKLVKTLEKSPKKAVAIMPLVWNKYKKPSNPRYQIQIRRVETFWDTLIVNSPILRMIFKRRFRRFIHAKEMPFFGIIKAQVLSGAFIILKTKFLVDIEFLDEGTFLYHEEVILGRKMQEKDVYGLLNAEVRVTHLQGASNKKKNKYFVSLLFAEKTKSQLYYIKRYCSASHTEIILFFVVRFIEGLIYSLLLDHKIESLINYFKYFKESFNLHIFIKPRQNVRGK